MKHNSMSHGELSSLCLELSMLFHSGVGTGDALTLLAEESDPAYQAMLTAMADQVDLGSTLSAAMRETGRFPAYVCGLVEVGERAGRTEEALSALARYYERRARLDRRIKSALLYPAVMLLLMLVVIGVLLIKVLPVFDNVYASLGGQLTGVAGGLLALGRALEGAMPVLWAVMVLFVFLILAFFLLPAFRQKLTLWWQERYGDRGIGRRLNTARVAQAFAMGMASNLSYPKMVDLAARLVEGGARRRCEACSRLMAQGRSLTEALEESGLLPPRQCRILELAQKNGAGDTAMAKIAQDLAEEGELALDAAVGRVEPALVLVCSLLVGLILLSVMLPLMNIMAAIG